MFENLCTLPLSSELFTQALHPTESVLAVGLSGGHVQCFRLPAVASSSSDDEDADGDTSVLSSGTGTIDTEWRTRRHKGSCRTLAYSLDGEILYSAGTDGLLKAASSSTGQVVSKIYIPHDSTKGIDPPTLVHALSPQTLLLATDSAALHLYDLRTPSTLSSKPSQTHRPHDDYISSLTPLPPTQASTSGFSKQWVTTGGTTLAVTDLRRGVLVKSEDQEEELLSSVFVGGLPSRPGRSKGEKVLVGSSNGILTLWERGIWDDQDERIIVDGGRGGGESLDTLVLMPEDVGDGGKNVCVGVGDGTIRIVKLGLNKVIGEPLRHDEVEAVVGLGFDIGGRLISGGGSIIKVWQEKMNLDSEEEEDSDDEGTGAKKRAAEGSDSDDGDDANSSDEDGRKSRRKKRKTTGGKNQGNGILGFKGLE
ncbi:probable WD repeat-containing protein jip5 [Phialocephala subalpina]|uniref:WD repeat-containing protein JIP5 n=1 Tax=Phialocephala subalpina TaxID=576137 RepID=A0A1L7XNK6_9HELO|nr:probable WD repeat-containing protein jip5 [Phialocephala subalpina]